MPAPIRQLAAAIAAEIAGASWSTAFTTSRAYDPTVDLQNITGLQCLVIPSEEDRDAGARGPKVKLMSIDLAFRNKVNTSVIAEQDAIVDIMDEVAAYWDRRRPATFQAAICVGPSKLAVCDTDLLQERRVFLTVARLPFRYSA